MLLAEFSIIDYGFRIETTTHALRRMKERDINPAVVGEVIKGLDYKIMFYNNSGEEIAIIDKGHDIAVIIEVRLYKVVVITVIDRSNIHIKEGTLLEQIA
ncbi:DUF4258 domain-containing protein [Iocasia frigidifontis]|uniref:DUF4258 domain-containing protein n=1 Tax=Iocasia fonsfrigidae TaxID=2682810 RepID=A0A8A7KEP5_9FIRM|nr:MULTISPECIES: DUF4258 domain-containing protein [Halanaerobiaceae]AZO95704.1 DUF4258 domain-containing protein [Halocella sp. SP3-1]MTI60899.1 DUF4258 domain-containing protein [Bacillota bacterium]QTL98565.1 DUF4258 domain-containing protein [Iocasia fonsfrigidae]